MRKCFRTTIFSAKVLGHVGECLWCTCRTQTGCIRLIKGEWVLA